MAIVKEKTGMVGDKVHIKEKLTVFSISVLTIQNLRASFCSS